MKRIRLVGLFILAATLSTLQCWGQGMTLQECLRYARDHSLLNKQQEISCRSAKWNTTSAVASFLPSINASLSGTLSSGRSIDPETNTYSTNTYLSNSYSTSLSLPLFDGLVHVNNYRMMKVVESQEKEEKKIQENKISISVITSFYNSLYYMQLVEQMQQQLKGDQENVHLAKREEALGTKSGADVAQMEANVASDEYSLVQQQNLYYNALVDLKNALSYPMDSSLTIDCDISEQVPLDDEHINPQDLFSSAVKSLPEALSAQYALKSSKYGVRKANGYFFPSLSFSAGISSSYYVNVDNKADYASVRDQFKNNIGEYMSLNLSIPIFNQLSNLINKKHATLNYLRQQAVYDQAMNDLNKNITQTVLNVRGSIKEYHAAEKKLEAVTQAHQTNERKFELGTLSALDYYTSISQLAEAKAQLLGKKVQYMILKMQLGYFEGKPFINEN